MVGGRPVLYEQHTLTPEEASILPVDLLPWKVVAAIDLAALIGVGITGAHLVRALRQFKQQREKE
jgi:hypothetical protein